MRVSMFQFPGDDLHGVLLFVGVHLLVNLLNGFEIFLPSQTHWLRICVGFCGQVFSSSSSVVSAKELVICLLPVACVLGRLGLLSALHLAGGLSCCDV